MTARLFVGTSSWADRSLVESGFYPPELKESEARLAYFAQRFTLAEVDSTYYALPSRRNIERWLGAVPDGFRFNVKVFALFSQHPTRLSSIPKSFHEAVPEKVRKKTRVYEKDVPEEVQQELWGIFRGALRPMREAGKLGAILVDFPPWFVPSEENRACIGRLRERLPDDHVIVEFRNRLWVEDEATAQETFALLRDAGCGFVCVDEPPGVKSAFPPVVAATASIAAVRFRGRNAVRWEDKRASIDERLDWWYTDEELAEWLPRVEQLVADAEEVYLSFSTKTADQSVVNAQRLQRLLGLS